jgi:hypothetical protein
MNMKFNKWTLGLVIGALALSTLNLKAQTANTNTIQQMAAQLAGVPAGVSVPAFDPNGLSFTNANYKVATGLEYESSGGTMSYLQADADFHHGSAVDIGAGAAATLSATGSGLHSAAADFELIKNFPNWQLVGKLGGGGVLEGSKSFFVSGGADINYNLTKGTGASFLGGAGGFTYVFAGVDLRAHPGGDLEKVFHVGAGFAF